MNSTSTQIAEETEDFGPVATTAQGQFELDVLASDEFLMPDETL